MLSRGLNVSSPGDASAAKCVQCIQQQHVITLDKNGQIRREMGRNDLLYSSGALFVVRTWVFIAGEGTTQASLHSIELGNRAIGSVRGCLLHMLPFLILDFSRLLTKTHLSLPNLALKSQQS